MQIPQELKFKFRFVKGGQQTGILSKKGLATQTELTLGGDHVRYSDIVDTTTRDKRLVIVLRPGGDYGPVISKGESEGGIIVLETYKVKALELERFVDRLSAEKLLQQRKSDLAAEGKGHLYRESSCPHCQARIDLSELDKSTYTYCRFCETVFREGADTVTKGDTYRVCDECDMFDRVRGYTEFYFYFLLVVYGFSYKRRHLCDNCASSLFWKVLLINMIFVLGVPSAIWLKIKSMSGRDPALGELAGANKLALKGKMGEAEPVFHRLYQQYPDHPGLLYNQAIGHLTGGEDIDSAMGYFDRSLTSCANYFPTIQFLARLQAVAEATQHPEQ